MHARWFGTPVKRREDPRLITGSATFIDDITLPGMLYMAFVRSPHAHAYVRRVDVAAARAMPGVVAVVTGEEAAKGSCRPSRPTRLPAAAAFRAGPRQGAQGG
jgi:CO/xanthine dehydrogenase Mo-binding subunit